MGREAGLRLVHPCAQPRSLPSATDPGQSLESSVFTLLHLDPACCLEECDSCDIRDALSPDGPQSRQLRAVTAS